MKLYLSSYKLGNKIDYLKEWIKENGNEIVLIPNAKDFNSDLTFVTESINMDKKMLCDVGFDVKEVSLRDYFGKCEKLEKDFRNYKAFYVVGGNVFCLAKAIQLSGFDKFIKKQIKKQNILYSGYSAGICVLSQDLDVYKYVDTPINPYNSDKIGYNGIGILDYIVLPHYKSNHVESKLIDECVKICDEKRIKYITICDGEVLLKEIN